MRRIAMGVTELSDSNRRTESWSENLRVRLIPTGQEVLHDELTVATYSTWA